MGTVKHNRRPKGGERTSSTQCALVHQEAADCSKKPQEFQGKEATCHQMTQEASTAATSTNSLECRSAETMVDTLTDHENV